MLDSYIRPRIDPILNNISILLYNRNISANQITLIGFVFGLLSIINITMGYYILAASLLILNRICDGLDGSVARLEQNKKDLGGFLDIVFDFIIYSGIAFSFSVNNPNNLFYSNLLLFSFMGTASSFLAFAIFAEKNNITTQRCGKKAFYYLGGFCEGTETFIFLLFIVLVPSMFNPAALIFSILCWQTTLSRIYYAYKFLS